MFFSFLNRPKPKENNLTVMEKPDYIEKIDNGVKKLVPTGKTTNVYELTQSHSEEVKINNIIKRLALGDVRGIRAEQPVYFDTTTMPTTYADALQSIMSMERAFYSLPVDVRAEFNNSKEEFISAFGTDKFMQAVGFGVENIEPSKVATFQPIEEQKE